MAKAPLDEFVDIHGLECLNQDDTCPVGNAFMDGDNVLQSDPDVDADLLVKMRFKSPVKLSCIKIEGLNDEDSQPHSMKIFQGKPDMGFDEAEDAALEEVQLDVEALGKDGYVHAVRFVKFQNVSDLQLFFGAGDTGRLQTKIKRIQFFGEPTEAMNMKEWKPVKG